MASKSVSIFNQTTVSDAENRSIEFTSGLGFYLIAPTIADEIEIDIFLQVQLSPSIVRQVRLEPMNLSNTERLTLIPSQLANLGLPMYLAIFPSEAIDLEIILLQPISPLEEITELLDKLNQLLEIILNFFNIPLPVIPASASSDSIRELQILGVI